jgi:hypothetical protein
MAIHISMSLKSVSKVISIASALTFGMMSTLAAGYAFGQAGSATLSSAVQDSSGAVVPGAKATLIQESTKVERNAVADKSGMFIFVAIPASTYDLLVNAPGFRPARRNGIAVHINDQVDLPAVVLTVAANDVSVTVTTENAEITPTTSGEQSYTLSSQQIQNLNIESRSAIELLDLIPGAANTGNFTGTYNREQAGFGQNASTYTVDGNRFDQVQIVSDGAPVTDLNTAGAAAVTPNVDMISEAKVETSAFSAVQPNGPIVFETQTKSGGSAFHGEAYFTARNHIFNSNDAYNKELGLPRANSSFYYPGLNIGGPVLVPGSSFNKNRDKLFFFAAAEFTQQHVDLGAQAGLVPTANMRNGIFSAAELGAIAGSSYRHYYQSNAPCTGNAYNGPFCNNGVFTPTIDKGGLTLMNLMPLPNADPSKNLAGNNYISDLVTSDPRNQENLKLDYAVSDRTHLSGRFNHENENVPAPYGPYNTVNFAKIPYPAAQVGRNASNSIDFNMSNTLSASLTNQLTVAFTRFNLRIDIGNQAAISRTATAYPYANVYPGSDILPNVGFSNTPGIYLPGGEAPPFSTIQNTTTLTDGLTKVYRNHLFQFGFYDVYATYNNQTTGNDNGTVTAGTYVTGSTGNEFADLLVGRIAGYSQSSKNIMANMINKRFDFYGEDTWKATSRFTINYGARLDHIAWWYDKNGLISVFNPAAYSASAPITAYAGMQDHATNPSIPLSGAKPLSFQFAPSVGWAYNLDAHGNSIVRGGFGTSFYVDPGINAFSAVGAPPNFAVFSYYTGSNTPLSLSTVSSVDPSSNPGVVYGSADPNEHQPAVTYSWNLAFAQVLPKAIRVEASYVGNTTRHLNGYTATNIVPLGSETGPYFGTYYAQLARPYKSYGDIGINRHNLSSNYNSLQMTASHATGWLRTWVTYTYGKALAYNCEDPFNEHNCYGPAPYDRSQAINVSYYIILPKVSQKYMGNHALLNGVLDGWEISGIEQYGSGTPFTDIAQGGNLHNEYGGNQVIGIYGNNSLNLGNEAITGTPDEISVPVVTCDPRSGLKPHQYFNPGCFAAPSQNHNGTFRLPYIHGPAYTNDELGIFKDFKVRDAGRLQIRAQSFNFLNRAPDVYQQYDSSLYMGYSTSGKPPDNASTAGVTTTRIGHRTIQLAAKYYF